jgi:hypothetical protein
MNLEIFTQGIGYGFLLAMAAGGASWQINRVWNAWKLMSKF